MLFSEPKIPQFHRRPLVLADEHKFQCSSASRKFLNFKPATSNSKASACFSALQRAENSSIRRGLRRRRRPRRRFSALQRAENSSITDYKEAVALVETVSVLFSEPKIPQFFKKFDDLVFLRGRFQCSSASRKFLNFGEDFSRDLTTCRFSALQRAENSSILNPTPRSARG